MDIFDPSMGAILVAGATSVGAALVLLIKKVDRIIYAALLAFSAGVMGFSVIEMLSDAIEYSLNQTAVGFLLGVVVIMVLEKIVPHMHGSMVNAWNGRGRNRKMRRGGECSREEGQITRGGKKAALLVGAVNLHNIPEGLAVGFAFASSQPLGWLVAISIALQDIPEGLLVSAPLACFGMRNRFALGFGILSGVVEGISVIFGFLFLSSLASLVPIALSLSAGAMAYVVLVELLPDAFRGGLERIAGICIICGFGLAFALGQFLAI